MIPPEAFNEWRRGVPWTSPHEIEQDLVLARLIAEVAQHPVLGTALAFKGGTCLHRLWLPEPWRYSEDLDYTICAGKSLDDVKDAVVEVGQRVGLERFAARMGRAAHPIHHTRLHGRFSDGSPMTIKFDVDPDATAPAMPYTRRPFIVDSSWFQADVEVLCYEPAELLASKVAALYARRRHRDLFDIWAALKAGTATPADVADCFEQYRPTGWTARLAASNLKAKLNRSEYLTQLAETAAHRPGSYNLKENVQLAAALIDTCAEATQPPKRWWRVLSSEGTASDILGDWDTPLLADSAAGAQRTHQHHHQQQPTLKDQILAVRSACPDATASQIAKRTGASKSHVNAVLRQTR